MSTALDALFNADSHAEASEGNFDRDYLTPGDYLLKVKGLFVDRSDEQSQNRPGQLFAILEVDVQEVLDKRTVANPFFNEHQPVSAENRKELVSLPVGSHAKIFFDLSKTVSGKWTRKGGEEYKRLMACLAALASEPAMGVMVLPSSMDLSVARGLCENNGEAVIDEVLRVDYGIGRTKKGAVYPVASFQPVGQAAA